MGVFTKLKNIFYDEEYVEDPTEELKIEPKVRSSVRPNKVEEPSVDEIKITRFDVDDTPKIEKIVEEEKEPTFSERELFKNEKTFNFTQFEDEELPPRRNVMDYESRTPKKEEVLPKEDSPRVFKPSPVISPIYGILDKDYKKEEIVSRSGENDVIEIKDSARSYDSVRRKAYGTLEDELEDTLNSMNKLTPKIIKESISDIDKEVESINNKANKIENLINKIEETTSMDISIGELEDAASVGKYDKMDDTVTDNTLEHDLFNLIDSMYDDKED